MLGDCPERWAQNKKLRPGGAGGAGLSSSSAWRRLLYRLRPSKLLKRLGMPSWHWPRRLFHSSDRSCDSAGRARTAGSSPSYWYTPGRGPPQDVWIKPSRRKPSFFFFCFFFFFFLCKSRRNNRRRTRTGNRLRRTFLHSTLTLSSGPIAVACFGEQVRMLGLAAESMAISARKQSSSAISIFDWAEQIRPRDQHVLES